VLTYAQLVIEVDGYAFHSTRTAFERDRRRDTELLGAGYRVLRVT
jgi:very-short-patch-repair endonuclease